MIFGAPRATNVLYTAYNRLPKQRKDSFDLYLSQRSPITQKRPWQRYTLYQGRIKTLIRGATLIHSMTRALSRIPTYPRQMTSACNVAEYFVKATFDCALGGPFDNLFLAWFSASQALCKGIIAVISASTVWNIYFLYYIKQMLSCQ